jgi:hypothetical protein
VLFEAIYAEVPSSDEDSDQPPSSAEDIPLSATGSLFLVAYFVFSSKMFDTNDPTPPLSIFPGHSKLAKQFIGIDDRSKIGTEEGGVIDSLLTIGLWLEDANKFVSGTPLENDDCTYCLLTITEHWLYRQLFRPPFPFWLN